MRTAAILTGGGARRLGGRDKSALIVEGRTILERQLAQLSAVTGLQEILLVGRPDDRRSYPGTRTVDDLVPDSGPLAGIHRALLEARGTAVFIAACDMPYITTALIEHLFDLSQEADLVMPRTEHGYHPLCAVYTCACLETIARYLNARRLKVMDLTGTMRTRIVEADELEKFGDRHRLLANVNTPTEYATLDALHGHKL